MKMMYLDPFIIFDLPLKPIDPTDLRKAYQVLMAEMKLDDTGTTLKGGRRISRDQVMQLYENLGDPTTLAAYEGLRASSLREFLINGNADALSGLDADKIISAEFYDFFKDTLHDKLGNCLVKALQSSDPEGVTTLVHTISGFPSSTRNELWLPSRSWLLQQQEEVAALRQAIKEGKEPGARIQEVADELLIACIAELPNDFLALTDGYVRHLESLAITLVQASGRLKLAGWILYQALKVPALSATHEQVQAVIAELGISPPSSSSFSAAPTEKMPANLGIWIGGALILAYLVFKALT